MNISYLFTDEKNEYFINLDKELWEEYFENVGDIVDKYQEVNNLEGKHFVVLIFNESDNNSPIACGSFKEYSKDTVEIKRVFVKKPYRKQGLATSIMEKLENEAKNRGYGFSILVTGAHNSSSQVLYKKLDYEIIEGFGFFKRDSEAICYKKRL